MTATTTGHTFAREDFPNYDDGAVRKGRLTEWSAGQYASYLEWCAEDVDELRAIVAECEAQFRAEKPGATDEDIRDATGSEGYALAKLELMLRDETKPDGTPRYTLPEIFLYTQLVARGEA